MFIRSIKRNKFRQEGPYPFNIQRINNFQSLDFYKPITIFIGENGSGKTTLLESIVYLSGLVNLIPDQGQVGKELAQDFNLIWEKKTHRGFYLKSQAFITYVNQLEIIKSETEEALKHVKEDYKDRGDYVVGLASMPYESSLSALKDRYGKGLDKMSHGEGYLELFKSRLVPEGLYILDEPELSLSPMRQLSLIALINEMIHKKCQFIIITHSPILMAIKNSTIYTFDEETIEDIDYQSIEHVRLTRDFLNNPDQYLKHLE